MYILKTKQESKLSALTVSGPFGAVKEQTSGLYAQEMAARGYHARSLNSNDGWNTTSSLSFINMPLLVYSSDIAVQCL